MTVHGTDCLVFKNEIVVKVNISQKEQHFESVISRTYVFT